MLPTNEVAWQVFFISCKMMYIVGNDVVDCGGVCCGLLDLALVASS